MLQITHVTTFSAIRSKFQRHLDTSRARLRRPWKWRRRAGKSGGRVPMWAALTRTTAVVSGTGSTQSGISTATAQGQTVNAERRKEGYIPPAVVVVNEANDRTGVNQAIRNVIWDNKGAGVPGAGDNVFCVGVRSWRIRPVRRSLASRASRPRPRARRRWLWAARR